MEMEVGTMDNGRGEVEAVKVAVAALVERAVAVEAVTVGVMAVASQNPQISSLLVVAATEAARVICTLCVSGLEPSKMMCEWTSLF